MTRIVSSCEAGSFYVFACVATVVEVGERADVSNHLPLCLAQLVVGVELTLVEARRRFG